MFKQIFQGASRFFTTQRIMIIVILLILGWALLSYSGSKLNIMDGYEGGDLKYPPISEGYEEEEEHREGYEGGELAYPPVISEGYEEEEHREGFYEEGQPEGFHEEEKEGYFARTTASSKGGYTTPSSVINPGDLLPQDQNSQWESLNPVSQGNIAMPDLLQAGYHIGLNTIGQTLRNPNYQLRSDPIIPKSDIGPWNQSTIEPDFGRVPLEVGYGGR